MLDTNPDGRDRAVAFFKSHVEAFEAASGYALAGVASILRRHPMNNTCMRFLIKFMKASNYDIESGQVQEWLKQAFSAQVSTVMIERSAKALRDHETRDCTSKMLQNLSAWEVLLNTKLLSDFGMREIAPGAAGGNPPPTFGERLFAPTMDNERTEGSVDLRGILKTGSWQSYSAQSQKIGYGQMEALRQLHERNRWEHVDQLWHTKLLGEGSIILHTQSGKHMMVLQVLEVAAICWPMRRIAHDMYALDLQATALEWVLLFSADEVQVLR